MSGIQPSNPLKLEALPDEIFLKIFNYVDSIDLQSFSQLNHRLHRIVRDVKVSIVIQWQEEEEERARLTSFIPTQIIHLEMRDYWSSVDLNKITELRSLTLDCTYSLREQVKQVSLRLTSQFFYIYFRSGN